MTARSKVRVLLAVATVALAGVAGVARADQAAQLYPIDLQVEGGEDAWHADGVFRLDWDRPPIASQGFPVTAIDFRVRDGAGAVVVPATRLPWDRTVIEGIGVPPRPGAYTADVWLEGPGGAAGPQVSATLRFDNRQPGAARPVAPAGWIAGDAPALVTIQHPPGPLPISGIRGYAVTVGRDDTRPPCALPSRCSLSETDLHGGIDDDALSLGTLPEGVSFVRVVAVSGAGVSSAEVASAVVRVDATRPETVLDGVPRGWAQGPVRVAARSTDSLSGMAAGGPNGAYTAIAVDGGAPRVEPGSSVALTVAGEGRHQVAFYARDGAGNVDDESLRTATVAIDEGPPRVAFAGAQDPADPERIEATVADPLSGADPGRGAIAVRSAGSRHRWLALPTVATAGRLVARWDSEAYPPGAYEFRATAYDAAGNAAASDRRGNGVKMVLVNPLKTVVELRAGFGGARPTARTVPYGRGVAYSGRLTSTSGSPLRNLPIEIVEKLDPGADPQQASTTVTTGADGRFAYRLRPGPSRRIEAVFSGTRTLGRARGGRARLLSLGGVRLRVSASTARVGGAPVVFSGRVGDLGAPIPPDGRAVELQFRLPNREWAEFRTVQTDAHGRFRYPYAFSDDDSRGVRFQFRAYINRGGWPYEPAASRPVLLTGR